MRLRVLRSWFLPVLVGSLTACGRPASANLLVNPTGGTTLSFDNNDDAVVSRSLGGNFTFFGLTINSIDVSTNGNLNSVGNIGYQDAPLSGLPSSINPFYDDLYVPIPSTVSDQVVAGSYYAATWNGVYDRADLAATMPDTFQAILFTGNTVLRNFQFRAGDIALSYGPMTQAFGTGTATVGLSGSSGSTTASLPGTTNGEIADTSLLPTGPSFLLFRPGTGGTTYTASIQSAAVPEPASWTLLGIGTILVAARRRGRRGAGSSDRLSGPSPR